MKAYSKTQCVLLVILVCLLLVFILGACGPSQAEIDAEATGQMIAQAATQTAEAPTATPPPTFTSTPANTSTPTNTPPPTETPIPPTDTPTPTDTPIPSTPTPAIIYGQVKVCFKLEEGVRPSTGLDVKLIDSEGNGEDKPVTTNANRCYTFKKVTPGLYRIEAIGVHYDGRLASGSLKDIVVQPDETVEVEVVIALV